MPAYIVIDDAEVAAEQPVTVSLMTRLRDNALYYLGAPTGTAALFHQTAAPLGWTKSVAHNDKALRVVSGSIVNGGTSAFSTVFGKTATDAHTLTLSQMAAHTHTHNLPLGSVATAGAGNTAAVIGATTPTGNFFVGATADTIGADGGGGSHTHPMDIRVQFIDVILATKD